MDESKRKTILSRYVALALGIICIVLVASLVWSTFAYSSKIDSLNSQVEDLNDIVGIGKGTDWVTHEIVHQTAGGYSSWQFSIEYAGIVRVWLFSDTNNTYVRVIYTCSFEPELHYDNQVDVGYNDTVLFPVLPAWGLEIRVGNTNAINNATVDIALITYFY